MSSAEQIYSTTFSIRKEPNCYRFRSDSAEYPNHGACYPSEVRLELSVSAEFGWGFPCSGDLLQSLILQVVSMFRILRLLRSLRLIDILSMLDEQEYYP